MRLTTLRTHSADGKFAVRFRSPACAGVDILENMSMADAKQRGEYRNPHLFPVLLKDSMLRSSLSMIETAASISSGVRRALV